MSRREPTKKKSDYLLDKGFVVLPETGLWVVYVHFVFVDVDSDGLAGEEGEAEDDDVEVVVAPG